MGKENLLEKVSKGRKDMKSLAYLCGLFDYPEEEIPKSHVQGVIEAFLKDNNQWNKFLRLLQTLREMDI